MYNKTQAILINNHRNQTKHRLNITTAQRTDLTDMAAAQAPGQI